MQYYCYLCTKKSLVHKFEPYKSLFHAGYKGYRFYMARYVMIDVSFRDHIRTNVDCNKISPFVCGNISTNSVDKKYQYNSLSISQPEPRPSEEKFQLFFISTIIVIPIEKSNLTKNCHRLNLVCSLYREQVNCYFSPRLTVQLPCTRPW